MVTWNIDQVITTILTSHRSGDPWDFKLNFHGGAGPCNQYSEHVQLLINEGESVSDLLQINFSVIDMTTSHNKGWHNNAPQQNLWWDPACLLVIINPSLSCNQNTREREQTRKSKGNRQCVLYTNIRWNRSLPTITPISSCVCRMNGLIRT